MRSVFFEGAVLCEDILLSLCVCGVLNFSQDLSAGGCDGIVSVLAWTMRTGVNVGGEFAQSLGARATSRERCIGTCLVRWSIPPLRLLLGPRSYYLWPSY